MESKPLTPVEAMQLAIEEGKKGAGFVSPNPLVGCVILDRNHRLLAKGYHARLGDLHAETHALKQISDASLLNGAHLYVTLEPCAHEGRQPSCAKTLAKLPLASIHYGLRDPHPKVAGQGAEILRQAGKSVFEFMELKDELEELAEVFLVNWRHGRAFVTLKAATSIDGRTALASGESQWITGEEAREHVHFLRGCHDAVLTGVGTVLKDDPLLNSRHPRFLEKKLPVVILDPRGELVPRLPALKLSQARKLEQIYLVTEPQVRVPRPIQQVVVPVINGDFDLNTLLVDLRKHDIHSVFVEAGEKTLSKFLQSGVGDRLSIFLAPKILGEGLGWTSGLNIGSLSQAIRMKVVRHQTLGEDLMVTGRLQFPQPKS